MLNDTKADSVLSVNFVQSDFFLGRIHELEKKYGMTWDQFVAEYSTGKLADECGNTDYTEWAFLCNHFMSDLLKPQEEGPPSADTCFESKKPEANSGFLLFWGTFVQRRKILPACSESLRH